MTTDLTSLPKATISALFVFVGWAKLALEQEVERSRLGHHNAHVEESVRHVYRSAVAELESR